MGKRKSRNYNSDASSFDLKNIFNNFKNNAFKANWYKKYSPFNGGRRSCNNTCWFTPAKCIVSSIIVITLLFYGVGLYGLIIIGLLLVLLQFV